MKKNTIIGHQGDVGFMPISTLPQDAMKLKTLTVAKGEFTGHSHDFLQGAELYSANGTMYAVLEEPIQLTHQEHNNIVVDKGIYEIVPQRELTLLGQIRNVLD